MDWQGYYLRNVALKTNEIMKEVCIINYGSNAAVYGIGTHIREYVHCLLRTNWKIYLVELGLDGKNVEVYVTENTQVQTIHIPYVPGADMVTYNKSVCRLLRLYLKDSTDLIFHFHYLQSDSLLPHIKRYFPLSKSVLSIHYLYWSARLIGNLALYHDIVKKQNRKRVKEKYKDVIDNYQQEKDFMNAVDKIVCLVPDTYALLTELYGIKKEKLSVISNGLTTRKKQLANEKGKDVRKSYYIRDDEKLILFVGRIDFIKGIAPLLSCFARVVSRYPNCRLILIGDGNISNMIKYAGKAITKITFIGRLDKNTLYQWYEVADLAVFPSYYEECSYVGIEMLMHGIPVVASNGYGVQNMFNASNAVIAPIENWDKPRVFEENLVKGICALLESEELSMLKRKQTLQEFRRTYQLKSMYKKYAELLAWL